MPETATLHIQARESDPIRVVELPGASVRIGRASFCDVRLPEPALAEEECQLRRRGAMWHLVPVSETGALSIEGRVVDRPRPLPYGVPLRVGDFSLTLRPSAATPPQWSTPAAAAPPVREAAAPYPAHGDSGTGRTRAAMAAREKQWEAKWKAAAEQLRSRTPARPEVDRPPSAERLAGWQSVDLPRRESAAGRTPTRPVETAAYPSLRTVTPPSAYPAARRAEPFAPPAAPAVIEDPVVFAAPAEPVIDDPVIFTPPAELDWTEAREPEPALPAVIEPVVEIKPQVVEVALEADTTLEDEVTLEVPEEPQVADPTPESPPTASLSERVGQGLLALWGRVAPRRADSPPETTTDDSPEPVAVWDALHPPSSRELPPQSGEDGIPTQSVGTSTVDCAGEASTTDDPPEPVESASYLREGEAPAEPTPQRGTAPEAQADAIADSVPTAPTQRPAPRRRPVARRRPRPSGRVPRLGSVRVVPREAPAQPSTTPPPTTPEPESDPFTGGTWQAHTGSWTGAHVTAGTWHAGNGSSAHADAAAGAHQSWPSASDILAARVTRPAPQPKAPARPRPLPTDVCEPEHFTIPLWLGWLPLTATAGFAAVVGVALAWTWSQDAQVAATVTNFLAASKAGDRFPLAPEALPPAAWWRSTGGTLARRAVALGRSEEADPGDVRALLTLAAQASPLDVTARLALARLPGGDDDSSVRLRSAGLARDVLALAWSGDQLAKAGQKDSALRAYRRALELAATAEVDRLSNPVYNDDPDVRRYGLPGEELVGPVVKAMAGHAGWTLDDWTAALPPYALAPLLAARELREADRATSDALLDRVLNDEETRVPPAGASAAVHHAARAEAHALKGQWAEAEALYREAVVLMPSERIARSWQVNLADLALRQNDDAARQRALDAANNHDPNDPITLRVVELQKLTGARTRDDAVGRTGHAQAR